MKRQVFYRYLGTNGVIESPVHLEDIYYVRIVLLTAGKDKVLTDGIERKQSVRVPEEEIGNWWEVPAN